MDPKGTWRNEEGGQYKINTGILILLAFFNQFVSTRLDYSAQLLFIFIFFYIFYGHLHIWKFFFINIYTKLFLS